MELASGDLEKMSPTGRQKAENAIRYMAKRCNWAKHSEDVKSVNVEWNLDTEELEFRDYRRPKDWKRTLTIVFKLHDVVGTFKAGSGVEGGYGLEHRSG